MHQIERLRLVRLNPQERIHYSFERQLERLMDGDIHNPPLRLPKLRILRLINMSDFLADGDTKGVFQISQLSGIQVTGSQKDIDAIGKPYNGQELTWLHFHCFESDYKNCVWALTGLEELRIPFESVRIFPANPFKAMGSSVRRLYLDDLTERPSGSDARFNYDWSAKEFKALGKFLPNLEELIMPLGEDAWQLLNEPEVWEEVDDEDTDGYSATDKVSWRKLNRGT